MSRMTMVELFEFAMLPLTGRRIRGEPPARTHVLLILVSQELEGAFRTNVSARNKNCIHRGHRRDVRSVERRIGYRDDPVIGAIPCDWRPAIVGDAESFHPEGGRGLYRIYRISKTSPKTDRNQKVTLVKKAHSMLQIS